MALQNQIDNTTAELERQRTRAHHFQRAEAEMQRQSIGSFLAVESVEAREQFKYLVNKNQDLEERFKDANDAKLRAEDIAAKEKNAYNFQKHITLLRNDEIEVLREELQQSQA